MLPSPVKCVGVDGQANLHCVRFGEFTADLRTGELKRSGRAKAIALPEQPLQVLQSLLKQPGQMVSREELIRTLWPGGGFGDFDHGLNKAVNKLREVLGDSAESSKYIETVARRGYRFIALVHAPNSATHSSSEIPADGSAAESRALAEPISRKPKKRAYVLAIALLIALASLGTLSFSSSARGRLFGRANPHRIQALAVLPLADLSSDAAQGFFADGMTEELTTDLGKIAALRVTSRTSAMQYKGAKKPLKQIAAELNVDALVEGTVARSGNRVRITANLVQASPEKHLWAQSYESDVGDALTVQGQIAQAVAREIQVKLTPNEQTRLAVARPVNPEAQDLYFRGVNTIRDMDSANSSEKAVKDLQLAIEKDPNYARAYSALALLYATWIPGMTEGPRQRMPKAKQNVLKALSLDNTLEEAHSQLGMIELLYDWDWSAAEEQYKQAIALNPNDLILRGWHARGLVASGHSQEAVAEAQSIFALGPTPAEWDPPIWVFLLARRYDLARERGQQLLELAPNLVWGHFEMAQLYEQQGQPQKSTEEFLKTDEMFGADPQTLTQLRKACAKGGAPGYWRRKLEIYEQSARSAYVPAVLVAAACERVGDAECAFKWLEKGFDERDDLMINLKVEPVFDSLQADPRFQVLLRRVGIP